MPVFIYIAAGLAGAHGDAQQLLPPQRYGAGQRRHVAVVAHGAGNGTEDVPRRTLQNIPSAAVKLRCRHIHKKARTANLAVHDHAGGGKAHGVYSGQMLGSRAQRRRDMRIMIAQAAGRLGLPEHLLGVDRFPVYHRRGLAVAAAQVDAHAAAPILR